jgi:hypothetical protein
MGVPPTVAVRVADWPLGLTVLTVTEGTSIELPTISRLEFGGRVQVAGTLGLLNEKVISSQMVVVGLVMARTPTDLTAS